MILMTSAYKSESQHRNNELDFCRHQNAQIFSAGIAFTDGNLPEQPGLVKLGRRTRFCNAISYLRRSPALDNEVIVLANSDIYFDQTIKLAEQIGKQEIWCLSKYQHASRLGFRSDVLPLNAEESQDAWVFRSTKWLDRINLEGLEMGRPGCENRLAYEAFIAGFRVINPSLSIKSYHVHDDYKPHAEKYRISGRYYFPKPVYLGCGPQEIGLVTDKYARPLFDFDPRTVAH